MMKKYLGLLIVPILLIAIPALADTITPSVSSVNSGSESGVTITTSACDNTSEALFLFDPSGNNVSGDGTTAMLCPISALGWTANYANFPTGLATGTYT